MHGGEPFPGNESRNNSACNHHPDEDRILYLIYDPACKPNKLEIVPKVSLVLISRVVYVFPSGISFLA